MKACFRWLRIPNHQRVHPPRFPFVHCQETWAVPSLVMLPPANWPGAMRHPPIVSLQSVKPKLRYGPPGANLPGQSLAASVKVDPVKQGSRLEPQQLRGCVELVRHPPIVPLQSVKPELRHGPQGANLPGQSLAASVEVDPVKQGLRLELQQLRVCVELVRHPADCPVAVCEAGAAARPSGGKSAGTGPGGFGGGGPGEARSSLGTSPASGVR